MTSSLTLDQLIGRSEAFAGLRRRAASIARRSGPVLLLGPTGTGKSELARAMHASGPRRAGPLLELNCSAIPQALIESELFGVEPGAFTGATARSPGKIRAADGGTLFLDEIGELDLVAQAKLLGVLDRPEVTPLGGVKSHEVDVRFIAATHRDLEALVKEGRFREDLYHRLACFVLQVPPLAERRSDIIELAEHLLPRLCAREGIPPLALSAEARFALLAAPWRGNIRELRMVLTRAIDRAADAEVHIIGPAELFPDAEVRPADFRAATELFQRALVEDALRNNGGSIERAAEALGIVRSYGYKLVAELGIDTGRFRGGASEQKTRIGPKRAPRNDAPARRNERQLDLLRTVSG